jgi:hypothetical protein
VEARLSDSGGVEEVPAIEEEITAGETAELAQVKAEVLGPVCGKHNSIGAIGYLIRVRNSRDARGALDHGVVGNHRDVMGLE